MTRNIIDHVDLNKLDNHYDVAVIGGGIVGAGIIRDLALQGIKAILIEKKDFSSQTSSKSSKMLHGGIRYLENFDFDLVFEALQEKNFWLKSTPHLCYESKFYLPVYKDSIRPLWMIKIGLFLYDLLSQFAQSRHRLLTSEQTKRDISLIKKKNLKGSGIYHDAIVDDNRLTIECLVDAKNIGRDLIQILNHVEAESFQFKNELVELSLRDNIKNTQKKIIVDDVIFATGPFTDSIMKSIFKDHWQDKLIPSKGSHLWVKKESLAIEFPVVLTPQDGRVIFVIPQKEKVLIGTTEVEHKGNMFDISASEQEIKYLIKNIKEYFEVNLQEKDIISNFSGIRPLVRDDSGDNRSKTARNHKIFQPHKRCFVITGGKYTTFRVMAKDVCELVLKRQDKAYNSTLSFKKFSFTPYYKPFETKEISNDSLEQITKNEFIRTEDDLKRRIS